MGVLTLIWRIDRPMSSWELRTSFYKYQGEGGRQRVSNRDRAGVGCAARSGAGRGRTGTLYLASSSFSHTMRSLSFFVSNLRKFSIVLSRTRSIRVSAPFAKRRRHSFWSSSLYAAPFSAVVLKDFVMILRSSDWYLVFANLL